jgi:hypothetical protein
MLEMETMVFRQISRLLGMAKESIGVCVRIYSVFSKLHIRFIDAPKATAMKTLATTPEVSEESIREKAFTMVRMSALKFKKSSLTAILHLRGDALGDSEIGSQIHLIGCVSCLGRQEVLWIQYNHLDLVLNLHNSNRGKLPLRVRCTWTR